MRDILNIIHRVPSYIQPRTHLRQPWGLRRGTSRRSSSSRLGFVGALDHVEGVAVLQGSVHSIEIR